MVMEYALQLNDFLLEGKTMVLRVKPFVDALAAQPGRADILPRTLDLSHQLFRFVQGNARLLGLDHLTALADALEYLLDRGRSGILFLTPEHLALLAKAVTVLDKGLAQILIDKGDSRLADAAAHLVEAVGRATTGVSAATPAGPAHASLEPSMQATLLRETEGFLETVEGEFVLWDFIAMDGQRVTELVRMLGQLRRNFALLEFRVLDRLCGALELTLQRFLGGEFFQTEYPERVFIRGIDAMRDSLNQFIPGLEPEVPALDEHLAALQGLIRQPIGALLIEAGLVDPQTVHNALKVQKAGAAEAPRRLGEVLVEMGEVTPDQIEQVLATQQHQRDRAERAEEALGGLLGQDQAQPVESVRDVVQIESRKLVRMIELIEQMADQEKAMAAAGSPLAELHGLAQSCRRDVLRIFAARLHRMVHDLALRERKKVYFVAEGLEETLGVEEMSLLFAPLWRLCCNAFEHGLEDADLREAAGKDRIGRLSLLALHQGDQVWVSVEDDGQGMDRRKILDGMVARGMVTPEAADTLSNKDIARMLLRPERLAVAGEEPQPQEPGLAAVNRVVQRMHGAIDMLSRPGRGARITLKIPKRG